MLKGAAYTDIARELEAHAGEELAHAIKIAKQIDYLGGMPGVTPKPVKTSNDPVAMLRADLENERTTVGRYRERIRQAEAMGEFALSETLRAIIVQEQEHEIDLSAALDINVPPAKKPAGQSTVETTRRTAMSQGDKSSYTDKQKRQAAHIEAGYEKKGVGTKNLGNPGLGHRQQTHPRRQKSGAGRIKQSFEILCQP